MRSGIGNDTEQRRDNVKKFCGFMAFGSFIAAWTFLGAIDVGKMGVWSGIMMSLLCVAGFGFFSWLSGAWYRV